MKLLLTSLSLALFCLITPQHLLSQDDDQAYVIVEYMKVKPGMSEQYLECETIWKMIHEERKKAGIITGWELEEVLYPSGTDTEYDFITITHFKNWKGIGDMSETWNEETWNKLTQTLTTEQKEFANRAEEFRDIVKREIWMAADMAFRTESDDQPKFRVENFMQIPSNGWDTWMEMETELAKPVHIKNMETGNRAGWALTVMVLPRGQGLPYQASTVDFYDSWEQMNSDEGASWAVVHPGLSEEEIGKRIEPTRTIVRSEVRMLVEHIK